MHKKNIFSKFESLLKKSKFHMVDIGTKKNTHRKALAMGKIIVGKKAYQIIKKNNLPKGDVFKASEIAGINGAKKAAEMITLCHPLEINKIAVIIKLNSDKNSLSVFCLVTAFSKTGVEMEALSGVNNALLTIYDLTKMIEPNLKIENICLIAKEGGKRGYWENSNFKKKDL